MILEAFQIYEDSICGGCGQSSLHSMDDANAESFDIRTVTCHGCAAIPEDPPKPNHGDQSFVVSRMSEDESDRDPYLYEEEGFVGSFAAPEHIEPIDGEDGI